MTSALDLSRAQLLGLGLIYLSALAAGMSAAAWDCGYPAAGAVLAATAALCALAGARLWRPGRRR